MRTTFMPYVLIFLAAICCLQLAFPNTSLAQDQMQLSESAGKDYESADKELNAVYKQLKAKYKDNTDFITNLQKAELAWISYRDQHVKAIFPNSDPDAYGSAYSMCKSNILSFLTTQRTKDLRRLLNSSLVDNTLSNHSDNYKKSEDDLANIYSKALKSPHPDEPAFAQNLKLAQDNWKKFRDADALAWQSLLSSKNNQMCEHRKIQLNKLRINSLNEWVQGIPEGDVCTGSRAVR